MGCREPPSLQRSSCGQHHSLLLLGGDAGPETQLQLPCGLPRCLVYVAPISLRGGQKGARSLLHCHVWGILRAASSFVTRPIRVVVRDLGADRGRKQLCVTAPAGLVITCASEPSRAAAVRGPGRWADGGPECCPPQASRRPLLCFLETVPKGSNKGCSTSGGDGLPCAARPRGQR